ncbi:hypothetical protein GCM10007167_00010 [Vulcaniibacterium thermophilum]|uniref:RHS repeat-associated core domain-containing protein n=2 Tax=Vulcaniibacterium thermophilum TaxID=1169913 RepID=A0A918YU73_9GAMM|nr:hypothetical protein GCM10007167_00010 [Vulcaniibacterium thermophilum]
MIWLDDLPVGLIAKDETAANDRLYYIQPDHLGSPRVVIDPIREKAVWTWPLTGEAFGADQPNPDPDADGIAFVFDMRFPGQRYDSASGLNYNYFRDYEPTTGRYVQSDPIGQIGGLATFAYSLSNPLVLFDRNGLAACRIEAEFDGDYKKTGYIDKRVISYTERRICVPVPGVAPPGPTDYIPDPREYPGSGRGRIRRFPFGVLSSYSSFCVFRYATTYNYFDEYALNISYYNVCRDSCGEILSRDFVRSAKDYKYEYRDTGTEVRYEYKLLDSPTM